MFYDNNRYRQSLFSYAITFSQVNFTLKSKHFLRAVRLVDNLLSLRISLISPLPSSSSPSCRRGVGGTVDGESALRSAENLSWIRAPPPVPWPDGGSESLRSPCGVAIYTKKNRKKSIMSHIELAC
ncbi:hypothetical protein PoB_005749200 [Plakobranchus ocellatus]|uniref:Uncharacterized protein n=1 Tax=Plakobranchus ocellatus TaxID=259542 RepID=A0AAV4CHB1_9GAST|nr:hypothetical protein PoB_005749200 [Plakobranchus ocellatus]